MRPHHAQQLPLPGSLDETVQLKEEIARMCQEVQWRETKIHALHEQCAAAEADRNTWRELHRQCETALHAARTEIALLQTNLAVARHSIFNRAPALPDWLAYELRRLVTLAHPDKWSAVGQEASVLAHEITIALNGLRDRLRGQV